MRRDQLDRGTACEIDRTKSELMNGEGKPNGILLSVLAVWLLFVNIYISLCLYLEGS